MKRNFIIIIIVVIIAIIFAFINNSNKDRKDISKSNKVNNLDTTYTINNIKHLKNTNNFLPNSINHIFFGTINSEGQAEGFHYANIRDSKSKIISGTESSPNHFGVFEGKVKINGIVKSDDNGYSTFFPSSLSPQMVVDSINQAYKNARNIHGNIYIGQALNGIEIEMYLTPDKKIISAFPKY